MIARIIGILVFVGGIAMMLVSNYIYEQIGEGNRKIENAERKMQTGQSVLKLNPFASETTDMITKPAMSSIQRKIDEGKATIEEYEILANRLKIGGIVAIIAGVIIFLLSFIKTKRRGR